MIRCLCPTKVKNRFIMIVYFECLDYKEIWKHPIQNSKNFLTLLFGRLNNFLNGLQKNEIPQSESIGYPALRNNNKNYQVEGFSILFVGNNVKLRDTA